MARKTIFVSDLTGKEIHDKRRRRSSSITATLGEVASSSM